MNPHLIHAPLINVNDDSLILLEWLRSPGVFVRRGEVIAVVETTKSTADLESDGEGYFAPLVEAGAEIRVGQVLAALTENPGDPIEIPAEQPAHPAVPASDTRRWTRKAEILAKRHGLDLSSLDIEPADGETVGEADLERYLASTAAMPVDMADETADLLGGNRPHGGVERVLVIGAGGAGAQILDVLTRVPDQRAVGLVDDAAQLHGRVMLGVPVLGGIDDAVRFFEEGLFDGAIISIGTRTSLRAEIFERLSGRGVPFTNVIDPRAAVLTNVKLGAGNAVMPFVQLATSAVVGDNNFFSTFVDIEHHNRVGSHCTFGPGVMTSGGVQIGSRVKFGAGVFVEPLLSIGDDCTVATGVALTRSVPAKSVVKTRANFVVRTKDD